MEIYSLNELPSRTSSISYYDSNVIKMISSINITIVTKNILVGYDYSQLFQSEGKNPDDL